MDGTRWCGGVLQHVPYVKTMFGAVMALKGACSQAVHNKERYAALAECVRIAAHSEPRAALKACGTACGGPSMRARAWELACACGYYYYYLYGMLAAECVSHATA